MAEQETKLRLCLECQWLEPSFGFRCLSPENVAGMGQINYVDGKPAPLWNGAEYARMDSKSCGREARWFRRKE